MLIWITTELNFESRPWSCASQKWTWKRIELIQFEDSLHEILKVSSILEESPKKSHQESYGASIPSQSDRMHGMIHFCSYFIRPGITKVLKLFEILKEIQKSAKIQLRAAS